MRFVCPKCDKEMSRRLTKWDMYKQEILYTAVCNNCNGYMEFRVHRKGIDEW